MSTKETLRQIVRDNLDRLVARVNSALRGRRLAALEPSLTRLGRGGKVPHWYARLKRDGTLPNMDGKTIGSVVEMLLVATLEVETLAGQGLGPLRITPARGVDLPDLDLGVKSPSENYCTSEPFFSAYERLHGSTFDALVLLTDYQQAKRTSPLKLQLLRWCYLDKTEMADENLCRLARKQRDWLLARNEAWCQKVFRFLAFINQSDWRGKWLLRLIDGLQDEEAIRREVRAAEADYQVKNRQREKKEQDPLPETDLAALRAILDIRPRHLGVIDAADNWVAEVQKDMGRLPNTNEWDRLRTGPLNGRIGMSFALQWRYNFGPLFRKPEEPAEGEE